MTIWYRASFYNTIDNVFSGEGGLYAPGRWNYLGRKAVYCSASIALCTLEWLSHNGLSIADFNYFRYSIEIPENLVKTFNPSELPSGWEKTPSTDLTRDFSEKNLFLAEKYIAIAVPSVVVPEEFNLIINPSHQKYLEIRKTIKSLGKHTAPSR